jgi:3-dehydroquinate synthetase
MTHPADGAGSHRTVTVDLGPDPRTRAYDAVIGDGVLTELGPRLADRVTGRRALVVADAALPTELVAAAHDSLTAAGFEPERTTIAATEANKTIDTASRLVHLMTRLRLERWDPVIALGGGIVGDIAGFAAAAYRRGVPLAQCPTTLLSMVDASVGGKTGVNIVLGEDLKKNMVGAFWQPTIVLADVATLRSLPKRHLRSGLAECIKHGLIAASTPGYSGPDADLFHWTSAALLKIRMGDLDLAAELIARNIAIKAAVVRGDEREESPDGGRALLNLGHTFAHVLEGIASLSPDGEPDQAPLTHGEAVALGLVAASATAHAMGEADGAVAEAVRIAVERLGILSRVVGLPPATQLLERMRDDKKVRSGRLRLILPTTLGRARVVETPPDRAVLAGWDAIRA